MSICDSKYLWMARRFMYAMLPISMSEAMDFIMSSAWWVMVAMWERTGPAVAMGRGSAMVSCISAGMGESRMEGGVPSYSAMVEVFSMSDSYSDMLAAAVVLLAASMCGGFRVHSKD